MAPLVGATELNPLPDPTQGIKNAFALRAMGQEGVLRQQQIQHGTLENQILQRQVQDNKTVMDALATLNQQPQTPQAQSNPQGGQQAPTQSGSYFDRYEQMLGSLQGKVMPATYNQLLEGYANTRQKLASAKKDELDNLKYTNDQFAQLIGQAKADSPEQYAQNWPQYAAAAKKLHPELKVDPGQPIPQNQLDNLGIGIVTQANMLDAARQAHEKAGTKEEISKANEADINAQQKQIQTAASQLGTIKDKDSYAQAWGELPAKIARTFPAPEQWTPQSAAMIQKAGMTPEQQVTSQQGAQRIGIEAGRLSEEQRHNKAIEGLLSPQAKDMAAENYFSTGQLPAGARSPAVITSIINRAAELHPGGNVAANSAEYKANVDSLKKIVPQRDAVVAFENTAGKNLDLFLGQAKKVIDTGSPFLNTPLRIAADKLSGSPDQAAYNAARQVAVNEIAKVVSNPNLSGTLSDSARNEISAFNPQNATLAQTYRVAQILKQDMANRHEAYDMQIADIKKRVGDKNAGQQHVIQMNGKNYQYNGSGDTSDIKNYTQLP